MRRVLIIAAAAALFFPLVAAGQDHGRGWGRGGGHTYGPYPMADRGDRRGDQGRAHERYESDPEVRRRGDPRNAPPPYLVGPGRGGRSWDRGQYLPPMYRGAIVRDPGRYRLRAPPPGYDWVGVGPNIYLMQRGTGMVLDAIPGGF